MSFTISCQHCSSAIRVEEEDRGQEVYCDSCGRENVVPAVVESEKPVEPEWTGVATAGPSVFSACGAAEATLRIVGEEMCLCGTKIPVRVEDYGGTVYCSNCGTEIQVGASLDRAKYRATRVAEEEKPNAIAATDGAKPMRPLWFRPRLAIFALLAMLAVTAGGWRLVRGRPPWLAPWAERLGLAAPRARESGKTSESSRVLTPAMIGNLAREHDPTMALIQAWRWEKGIRRDPRIAKNDPRLVELSRVKGVLQVRAGAVVTVETIGQLLAEPDPVPALVQAQVWKETLDEQKTPAADPRQRKLADVIEKLTRPSGKPSLQLSELERLTRNVAETLKSSDLSMARAALERLEQHVQQSPDDLGPRSLRVLAMKAQLSRQEAVGEGAERIRKWLTLAGQELQSGEVTAGLEHLARAKSYALQASLIPATFQELDSLSRDLLRTARFAQGKRAVEDAERCSRAGDVAERNRQARQAFTLLPGLPESQIGPLLERIRAWRPTKGIAPLPPGLRPLPATELARQLQIRQGYEEALEIYGEGKTWEAIAACLELDRLLRPVDTADVFRQWRVRIAAFLFERLEAELCRVLDSGAAAVDDAGATKELARVRQFLDRMSQWRGDRRWRVLDAAVRQRLADLSPEPRNQFVLPVELERMTSEADILAAIDLLPMIIVKGPRPEEARVQLAKAKRLGSLRAQKLLVSALAERAPALEVYRDKLRRAAAIDSQGVWGNQARQLLREE